MIPASQMKEYLLRVAREFQLELNGNVQPRSLLKEHNIIIDRNHLLYVESEDCIICFNMNFCVYQHETGLVKAEIVYSTSSQEFEDEDCIDFFEDIDGNSTEYKFFEEHSVDLLKYIQDVNVVYINQVYNKYKVMNKTQGMSYQFSLSSDNQSIFADIGQDGNAMQTYFTIFDSSKLEDCIGYSIGKYASRYNSMKKLQLQDSGLKLICSHAFLDNASLSSAALPESLQMIDDSAFKNCYSLKNVNFSALTSLMLIDEFAFSDCSSLAKADLHCTQISSIDPNAFEHCFSLEQVKLPSTVKTIYDNAFLQCSSLASIDMSNTSVEEIQSNAFQECINLSSVKLPSGTLRSIGEYAFLSCISLRSIDLDGSGILSIHGNAFGKTSLESIAIPDSVEYISPHAFEGLLELSIYISSSKKHLLDDANLDIDQYVIVK